MPSYDYRCQKCRVEFTIERSMKASTETNCNKCGSDEVSRIWNMNISTGTKGIVPSQATPGAIGGSCCGGSCSCC